MLIFPAIDLFGGKAVRLLKGDYNQMTVYHNDPVAVAKDFAACGAKCIHLVDLEGAKDGTTPNIETVAAIKKETGLFAEIGGGIRNMQTVERYFAVGLDRIILGTAAVEDEPFLQEAVNKYGDRIAVGIDIKNGTVATRGWLKDSREDAFAFFEKMQNVGVRTFICTDISKDGAMKGTNLPLYKELSTRYSADIIASGGVSSIADVAALAEMSLYGAIIGRAYYTGAVSLKEAIEVAK